MQSWISNITPIVMPITAVLAVVFAGIKLWMEIRANAAIRSDIAMLKRNFVMRNWAALLMLLLGLTGMLSVALVPLSPASVLFALVGGVCAAGGFAGVLVMESNLQMIDALADKLAGAGWRTPAAEEK